MFIWEAALAAYLDGIRFLSVRRYTLALVHALDHGRLASVDISLSPLTAAVGTTVVLVVLHRARDKEADADGRALSRRPR